jgi:hypothetical protein
MSAARQFCGFRASFLLVVACGGALAACSPGIGDACDTALRCSQSATRLCDLTQPNGYCTLADCQEGTCPSDAVCVTFWPKTNRAADVDRLSTNYCMAKCDDRSDCRKSDGYDCLSTSEFGAHGGESMVLGPANQKFCAVRSNVTTPQSISDAGAP